MPKIEVNPKNLSPFRQIINTVRNPCVSSVLIILVLLDNSHDYNRDTIKLLFIPLFGLLLALKIGDRKVQQEIEHLELMEKRGINNESQMNYLLKKSLYYDLFIEIPESIIQLLLLLYLVITNSDIPFPIIFMVLAIDFLSINITFKNKNTEEE